MTDQLVPWNPTRPGCGAGIRRGEGQFTPCDNDVRYAGTKTFPHTRATWRTYACDYHRDHLDNPRRITDEDLLDIAWRWRQLRAALAGQTYQPVEPIRRR